MAKPVAVDGNGLSASRSECQTCLAALLSRSQADFEIDLFERILHRSGDFAEVLAALAERLCEKGWYLRAVVFDERLVHVRPHDPFVRYNYACSLSRVGRKQEALAALRSSIKLGFADLECLEVDPDLTAIRGEEEFEACVKRLRRVSAGR